MADEDERLAFVIGQWVETCKTVLRLKMSEGDLLAALQAIDDYEEGRLANTEALAVYGQKKIARDAIARQKEGT